MQHYLRCQELSAMQAQLSRIEQRLRSNPLTHPHDITIDNKSGRDLRLTINLEDNEFASSRMTIQSKIGVPNNSCIQHIISTDCHSQLEPHSSLDRSKYLAKNTTHCSTLDASHLREMQRSFVSMRQEQKFLPITRLQQPTPAQHSQQHSPSSLIAQSIKQHEQQSQKSLKQGKEILIAGEDEQEESEIRANQQIQELVESQIIKTASISQRKCHQNINRAEEQANNAVNLPYSIKKSNKQFEPITQETTEKQENHSNYERLDDVRQSLTWRINALEQSSSRKPMPDEYRTWKVQPMQPASNRIQVKLENEKTYTQISREKSSFKKLKQQERQNRLHERLKTSITGDSRQRKSHLRCISNEKEPELTKNKKQNAARKADDLFLQRKDECLRRIEGDRRRINSIRKQSSSKDRCPATFFNNDSKRQKTSPERREERAGISPMAEQIGNRLYSSKGKRPCEHNSKFNEWQQRERFERLVKQNIYVSRYLSRDEREEMFQSLLKSQDSVSLWPTKIANFAFSKMRRSTNAAEKASNDGWLS